ncbi:hypothetical protein G5V57_18020 [Nordella sp. HKS 07]|uniref:hypothetical protein n=1 Tax=Nordella sp. HKS 07 TaxID=2712222 RepID=UPI0013E12499|nr:hypothetical protein [Nordella sp. HKS 07]QIG49446.1 hypothetical protein G5V57_18020 [Nordella sp. HKS 07]
MLILFLKSKSADPDEQMPLPEKLRRILLLRINEAKTEEDRRRAQRELDQLGGVSTA